VTVFPGLERRSEVPLLRMTNLLVIVEGRVGGAQIWSDQAKNVDPGPEGRPLQPLQRLVARSDRLPLSQGVDRLGTKRADGLITQKHVSQMRGIAGET